MDLTTLQLLTNESLGEKAIQTGGRCGGIYVDREFIALIGEKVGLSVMIMLQENHEGQLQYMIMEFCKKVKFLFTGYREDYKTFEMDLGRVCPVIRRYVIGSRLDQLEYDNWIIELKFEDVKKNV